ncbi:hypothetical protein Aau02nite_23810 [Amorphoplanes auranticolor]|uniref:Uncharacterized protein n=1 Tax=Actinoplanes auranticolor TaxID=47988 RepID=A0A919VRG3_9ACTN|nr:hypothetical protein Aau02nite_23810 [Actinoplanes auranticolor]
MIIATGTAVTVGLGDGQDGAAARGTGLDVADGTGAPRWSRANATVPAATADSTTKAATISRRDGRRGGSPGPKVTMSVTGSVCAADARPTAGTRLLFSVGGRCFRSRTGPDQYPDPGAACA